MRCLNKLKLLFSSKKILEDVVNEEIVVNDISDEEKTSVIEAVRELYINELTQQNTNNNLFFTYIGALAICISGLSFPYANILEVLNFYSYSFIIALITYFICIIIIMIILRYSYLHQFTLEYQRVPPLLEVIDYARNSNNSVKDLLIEYYNNAAQFNLSANTKKNSYFRVLKRLIIFLLLFESISYMSYNFVQKQDKVFKIQVMGDSIMSNNQKSNVPPQSNKVPQKPVPQMIKDEAPSKPTPQYIQESWDPKNGNPKRGK